MGSEKTRNIRKISKLVERAQCPVCLTEVILWTWQLVAAKNFRLGTAQMIILVTFQFTLYQKNGVKISVTQF